MPRFIEATVAEILLQRPGLQRVALESDAGRAYILTEVIGPVAVGDRIIVNTTAVDLGLGTGGWHIVHWNLSRDEWSTLTTGHIMKARYTSMQSEFSVAEEALPARELGTKPVVVCELHSQMAIVAMTAKRLRPDIRIDYVMTDQAALPIAISDLVYELKSQRILENTITCGQAFGGDLEAVNVASALSTSDADLIIVSQGPGVVGTGTTLGFSGFEMTGILDAVIQLGGTPYFALRYSETDARERHNGLSHHSQTILHHADKQVRVAVPSNADKDIDWQGHVDVVDIIDFEPSITVTTMGRPIADDPLFFSYSAAAAIAAMQLLD